MTWLDVTLFVVIALCIAVGARLGSLWTASCLAGGFVGAFVADTYALSVAGSLARFPGAPAVAGAFLFVIGAAAVILPGLLLSKIFKGMILGVADSAFGFVLGAFAGILALTTLLLALLPMFPSLERSRAWKESTLVRPLHHALEQVFQSPRFGQRLSGLGAAKGALRELKPFTEKAARSVKQVAQKAIDQTKRP